MNRHGRVRAAHGDGKRADKVIEQELTAWFSKLPKKHPSKKWYRYRRVDGNGPWRNVTISWLSGGAPEYDLIHPVTEKPCAVPEGGWRFGPDTMQERIKLGLVVFRDDHTEPAFRKSCLRRPAIAFEDEDAPDDKTDAEGEGASNLD